MHGLKDLVSTKNTDKRLPPLTRGRSSLAGGTAPLPSISQHLAPSVVPPIDKGIAEPSSTADTKINSPRDGPPQYQQSMAISRPVNNGSNIQTASGSNTNTNGQSGIRAPAASLFQTSAARAESTGSTIIPHHQAVAQLNSAKEVSIDS